MGNLYQFLFTQSAKVAITTSSKFVVFALHHNRVTSCVALGLFADDAENEKQVCCRNHHKQKIKIKSMPILLPPELLDCNLSFTYKCFNRNVH